MNLYKRLVKWALNTTFSRKWMNLYKRLVKWELNATFSRKWMYATLYGLIWLGIITTVLGYVPWREPDKLFVFIGFSMPIVAFFAYIFVKITDKKDVDNVGKEKEQKSETP
jgi:hypothetical protein